MQLFYDFGDQTQRICDWHNYHLDSKSSLISIIKLILEFAQTHVHWVTDTIQPSHPLLPPYPPALNLSQHQGLFQWVNSSIRWPKYWSFIFSTSPSSEYSGLISLFSFRLAWSPCNSRISWESSPAPQFKSINFSTLSLLYGPTLTGVLS